MWLSCSLAVYPFGTNALELDNTCINNKLLAGYSLGHASIPQDNGTLQALLKKSL